MKMLLSSCLDKDTVTSRFTLNILFWGKFLKTLLAVMLCTQHKVMMGKGFEIDFLWYEISHNCTYIYLKELDKCY